MSLIASKKDALRLLVIIAVSVFLIALANRSVSASSPNVSVNCEVTQVNQGDEVDLVVTTRAMCICSFIASVKYDGELLEYKGFRSTAGEEETAYLVDSKGKKHNVVVEHAEDNRSLVGMYMVGTNEVSYIAGEPFVTLVFKAKGTGVLNEESFSKGESTDGTDGYTSEGFGESLSEESSETTFSNSTNNINSEENDKATILYIIIIVVLIILLTVILYFNRKKKRNSDKSNIEDNLKEDNNK